MVNSIAITPQAANGEEHCMRNAGGGSTDTLSTPPVNVFPPFHTPEPPVFNVTPKGSEVWFRKVDSECTPRIGMFFSTLERGIEFYKVYAISCGFETRNSSSKRFRDKIVRTKTIVCNREGYKQAVKGPLQDKKSDQKKEKKSVTKIRRVGCKAEIKFIFASGGYVIGKFHEGHNHPLALAKNREFLKLSRNLNLYHKQTIINNSRINIGPTKSYRICAQGSNGAENVGASLLDFKNFQRDIKVFVGGRDAQMLITKLKSYSETRKGFYFAYDVDADGSLRRIFWCDAVARRNYSVFGDALSYDPTYGTNRYCMVFTPFTGVDNHKKTVCFGAALISHEDEPAFSWVFRHFLTAMSEKEPQFIITDQDLGIKKAVREVFKTARHRYCVWHIMQKMPKYVGPLICDKTDFLPSIDAVVWDNDLEAFEFEEKWNTVLKEFKLSDHGWLVEMYKIREEWIPSYFRDLPMGNILRTTQRSESSNSFFKNFENQYGTLVEFWMRFESAMDQQRHNHKRLEMESDNSIPQTVTPIPLEKHARSVYTHAVFYDFQVEVKYSTCACTVAGFSRAGSVELTTVDDTLKQKVYDVRFSAGNNETSCTCRLFERKGYVCRHILWIWSGKRLKEIPQVYIMQRWSKNAVRNERYDIDGSIIQVFDNRDRKQLLISDVWAEFYATIGLVVKQEEKDVKGFLDVIKAFRGRIAPATTLTKTQELELLLDCSFPEEVNIHPPKQAKNKGSGKRLKSQKEKAIVKANKPKRRCGNCKRLTNHDQRNCDKPFAETAPEVEEESEKDEASYEEAMKPKRRCRNCKRLTNHDQRNCDKPFAATAPAMEEESGKDEACYEEE